MRTDTYTTSSMALTSMIWASLILPSALAQQTPSYFDLYKNSGFGPCQPITETSANDQWVYEDIMQSNFQIFPSNQHDFCVVFGSYTILPTIPNTDAFYTTWITYLTKMVTLTISAVALMKSFNQNQKEMGWFKKLIFLPNVLWAATSYVWWWIHFGQFIKDPIRGPSPFIIAWIGVMQYYFTLHSQPTKRKQLRWLAIAFALPQIVAGFVITGIKYNNSETASDSDYLNKPVPDYRLLPGYQLPSSVTCSLQELSPILFNDQRVLWAGRSQSVIGIVTFTGTIFLWTVLAVLGLFLNRFGFFKGKAWSEKSNRTYSLGRAAWITMLVVAALGLAIEGGQTGKNTTGPSPIMWDNNCHVINIMMTGKFGFYDIDISKAQRIVQSLFLV